MLKLLSPATLVGYVVISFVVAFLGRKRIIGFWGFFFLSLMVTPVVTGFFLFVATPVKPRPRPTRQARTPRVNAGA